jgi:hypothetical protein
MRILGQMKIVRTSPFNKCLKKLNASESDIERLEAELAANPAGGDVIQGLSGARKIRFAMGGKGKRGGGRAVYVVVWRADTAYLLFAYSKAVQEELSNVQRDALAAIIKEIVNG